VFHSLVRSCRKKESVVTCAVQALVDTRGIEPAVAGYSGVSVVVGYAASAIARGHQA
jgi:hypothetical protein